MNRIIIIIKTIIKKKPYTFVKENIRKYKNEFP